MIRMAILVEGETEEAFVNRVLAEHLRASGVVIEPIVLRGNITVQRLASRMANVIWSFDWVTSLVDFYGFRDKGNATPDQLEQNILETIDHYIGRSWDRSRVVPYVQLHEFEALLFSNVEAFAKAPNAPEGFIEELRNIRSQFSTPEDINDNTDMAPSRRIARAMPRYSKVAHGPLVAQETGLDVIRSECPRFNAWVARLESLA